MTAQTPHTGTDADASRTQPLMLHRRLAYKVATIVLLVEVLIFVGVAVWTNSLLSRQSDDAFRERVLAISNLMGRGLLSYASLDDPDHLKGLLGDELEMALLIGANGYIFNSIDPAHTGKRLDDISGIDASLMASAANGPVIMEITENGQRYLMCLAPLRTAMDQASFLYAYFKARTVQADARKQEVATFLIYGALLGVAFTWVFLMVAAHHLLLSPIDTISDVLERLRKGYLDARVPGPISRDELGAVQENLNAMALALEENVSSLKREITQRRAAQELLRQSNETLELRVIERTSKLQEANAKLRGILDNSPAAIYVANEAGEITLHNKQFPEVYGLPLADMTTQQIPDLFTPEVAATMLQADSAVRATIEPLTFEETVPIDDHFATLMTTKFPLIDDSGVLLGVCSIATDITDRKRLEAEALRAGQLATIGELAASVAHEINNPITGIINYAQLLSDESEPHAQEMLDNIITQSERIAAIVRSLLSYSRAEKERSAPVDLRNVIEDCFSLTRYRLVKAGIKISLEIDDNIPLVRGRARELQQVLLNLLVNAYHALQEQKERDPDATLRCIVRVRPAEPHLVALEVEDTGVGVAEALLPKLTLPFFTTKPADKGTGLGLSISRNIIHDHHGELQLQNHGERGFLARVLLPAWETKDM